MLVTSNQQLATNNLLFANFGLFFADL